uniref:Uncharacterized protein n=1 Tax=Timema bartmani TaxID=61472 RepID=A0A7R9ENT5_9NEOP|nr:unnamed protein product [Timema bartmani]
MEQESLYGVPSSHLLSDQEPRVQHRHEPLSWGGIYGSHLLDSLLTPLHPGTIWGNLNTCQGVTEISGLCTLSTHARTHRILIKDCIALSFSLPRRRKINTSRTASYYPFGLYAYVPITLMELGIRLDKGGEMQQINRKIDDLMMISERTPSNVFWLRMVSKYSSQYPSPYTYRQFGISAHDTFMHTEKKRQNIQWGGRSPPLRSESSQMEETSSGSQLEGDHGITCKLILSHLSTGEVSLRVRQGVSPLYSREGTLRTRSVYVLAVDNIRSPCIPSSLVCTHSLRLPSVAAASKASLYSIRWTADDGVIGGSDPGWMYYGLLEGGRVQDFMCHCFIPCFTPGSIIETLGIGYWESRRIEKGEKKAVKKMKAQVYLCIFLATLAVTLMAVPVPVPEPGIVPYGNMIRHVPILGVRVAKFKGSERAFALRESGKPICKTYLSTPDRDLNPDHHAIGSLV